MDADGVNQHMLADSFSVVEQVVAPVDRCGQGALRARCVGDAAPVALKLVDGWAEQGAVVVLGTLLHEATHALAQARNINDTARIAVATTGGSPSSPTRSAANTTDTGPVPVHADDRQHRSIPHGPRELGPSIADLPPPATRWRRHDIIIRQPGGLRPRWWPTHPGVDEPPSASVRSSARSEGAISTLTEPRVRCRSTSRAGRSAPPS